MPRKSTKKQTAAHHIKRGVKHAVVPHKGNAYRPHAIRWKGIALALAIVAALQCMPLATRNASVLGASTDVTSQILLDETNAERSKAGVEPLEINSQLSTAATNKARDMFKQQYWSHVSPDGKTPWYWIKGQGYQYSYAGENLAKGFRTSDALILAWMNSKQHKENMLNPHYKQVGFAVIDDTFKGKTTKLVVAMYGNPAAQGDMTQTVLAARGGQSPMTQLGVTMQTMTPTLLASVLLLMTLAVVALGAHMYRKYLPKPILKSWRRHHGLYKAIGMTSLVLLLIVLYSDGQIV